MSEWGWVAIAAVVIAAGWFAQRRGWIDLSGKARSSGKGMLLVADEIFAPNRHEIMMEQEAQERLPVPAPVPGDGDLGITFADDALADEQGRPPVAAGGQPGASDRRPDAAANRTGRFDGNTTLHG